MDKDFKIRVKKPMDLIMLQSVNKNMAVVAFAVSPVDALEMLNYINSNL